MQKFWQIALGVAGIGAIAFSVFYSLFRRWLSLTIFSQLTSDQTYRLMLAFLLLTIGALVAGLVAYLIRPKAPDGEEALQRLDHAWKGVNYIDCRKLVGPDVARAADALQMTSTYWRRQFLSRDLIADQYGGPFVELDDQLDGSDQLVPGYEKLQKTCGSFLTPLVRAVYKEIKKHGG